MRMIFTLIIFFSYLSWTNAQEWNEKYGAPVVVLIETNPWLMVIGSDAPTISIYQYGDVIYKRIEKRKLKYYSTKLDTADTQKLIYSLGITDSLIKMQDFTTVSFSTDQPTNELILNFDSLHVKKVYGNLRSDPTARKLTPDYFLRVFDNLISYSSKKEKEWLPDYIEVMLTDYSHSPEIPLPWQSNWPDLKSKSTIQRSESLYSVFLDKGEFKNITSLTESLKEKQAVEVNGKKFSISIRLPFPNIR